jgi:hypothetical protein
VRFHGAPLHFLVRRIQFNQHDGNLLEVLRMAKDVVMREIHPKQREGVRHKLSNIVLLSGEPL